MTQCCFGPWSNADLEAVQQEDVVGCVHGENGTGAGKWDFVVRSCCSWLAEQCLLGIGILHRLD